VHRALRDALNDPDPLCTASRCTGSGNEQAGSRPAERPDYSQSSVSCELDHALAVQGSVILGETGGSDAQLRLVDMVGRRTVDASKVVRPFAPACCRAGVFGFASRSGDR